MNGRKKSLIAAGACVVGLLGAPAARAAPHGCVSVSNNYWLSPDVSRRSLVASVNTNKPCTFFFAAGDTFSGNGEYKISCATGGSFIDNYDDPSGPKLQVPIPQPCAVGAKVAVHAGHLGTGGAVVAGSPT
jgi:hypothetical protein